jgi:hypothetical protein
MKKLETVLNEIPQLENFQSSTGKKVANQFKVITNEGVFFKSYDTFIAAKLDDGRILLDFKSWDCSNTTSKYRNQFLNLDKKRNLKIN